MVFAVNKLNQKKYNKALKNGANIIIYNQIDFNLEKKDNVRYIEANVNRVPSTWYLWEKNNEKISVFKKKYPELFQIGKYDITLAIQKLVYWSNYRTSFIEYTYESEFKNEPLYYKEDLYQFNKLKIFSKYLKLISKGKKSHKAILVTQLNENKIGIKITDIFELSIYKYILLNIVNNDRFVVFVPSNSIKKAVIELGIKPTSIIVIETKDNVQNFPIINLAKLKKSDWYILNQIINEWQHIHQLINECETYLKSGIKKLLINEGENGLVGAIIGEVMKKNSVLTYNTMNGLKSGEAQDAFVSFDYWFVWDEQMKSLLMEKNSLPEKMLLVSGHLMEDEVTSYPNKWVKKTNSNKKVISLFSVRDKRQKKMEAFLYLYQLAEQNPQIQLLIRKHPSEKDEDLIFPSKELENVTWVEYNQLNSKETLYDQLSKSDLSICFGSTVALESKWFGVPCITFEKREESLIYLTDNETIFHVKELDELIQKCTELLAKGKAEKPKLNKVVDYIVETLLT
jgi:hypothetical protein